MNRVEEMIHRRKESLKERLGKTALTQGLVNEAGRKLDMEFDEFVKFQELKSLAAIDGTLTVEEAQTVYEFLGETPEHFNAQPIEVKIVLTGLFGELLSRTTPVICRSSTPVEKTMTQRTLNERLERAVEESNQFEGDFQVAASVMTSACLRILVEQIADLQKTLDRINQEVHRRH